MSLVSSSWSMTFPFFFCRSSQPDHGVLEVLNMHEMNLQGVAIEMLVRVFVKGTWDGYSFFHRSASTNRHVWGFISKLQVGRVPLMGCSCSQPKKQYIINRR